MKKRYFGDTDLSVPVFYAQGCEVKIAAVAARTPRGE